jgi:spore coat polysaccharide biosynthesis protein SpsF
MPNILVISQARCESTRLPDKVLLPLAGQPMILWHLSRLARLAYPVVVATPDTPDNVPLAALCERHGFRCHLIPGDPNDVLRRFAQVVALYPDVEHIVRVTADCPLLDPRAVEKAIRFHIDSATIEEIVNRGAISNIPGGAWGNATHEIQNIFHFPHYTGLAAEWGEGVADCEVFTREALLTAHAEATKPHHTEHVGPYIWEQPARFRLAHLPCPFDLSHLRTSVDTKEDLLYVQIILERCLARYGFHFGWRDVWWAIEQDAIILEYMAKRPINQAYLEQAGSGLSWQEERYASGASTIEEP